MRQSRVPSPDNRYLYNGKELQQEIQWLDYGARMYDAALGRFFTQDRFAEKYLDFSPYQYAAGNPVKYIDVNGDSLYITFRSGFLGLGKKHTVLYNDGKLTENGEEYTGKVKGFLKKTIGALNEISNTEIGSELVTQLQESRNSFTIQKGKSSFEEANTPKSVATKYSPEVFDFLTSKHGDITGGSGGVIRWNSAGGKLPTIDGMAKSPLTDLAHEMFHAQDSDLGKLDNMRYLDIKTEEWNAVYRENILRSELNIPLRTHYSILNGKPSGPRMLTPANRPYLPSILNPKLPEPLNRNPFKTL